MLDHLGSERLGNMVEHYRVKGRVQGAGMTVPSWKSVDVIRLVYEKFRPMTKNSGPLSAGEVSIDGKQGSLYLTEFQYWLWSSISATKELTHPEVDAVTTPQALVRSLLASTAGKIKAFEVHLDRIEQRPPTFLR